MNKNVNALCPIPLWKFVKVLEHENATNWGERSIDWITESLNARMDDVLYHKSASNSSLSYYVMKNRLSLSGKTAHCDVQHCIWKLNLDAGNDKCPIDPLWAEDKHRFFREGSGRGLKFIDRVSFRSAILYATELSRRPYTSTGRGVICPAKDGCFCRSLAEVRIDDWLYEHGIEHQKEPNYPRHDLYNKRGLKKADWKVKDTLIEYAGLITDNEYRKRFQDKLALAKDLNIDLIVILQDDLNRLDEVLGTKFDNT